MDCYKFSKAVQKYEARVKIYRSSKTCELSAFFQVTKMKDSLIAFQLNFSFINFGGSILSMLVSTIITQKVLMIN